MLSKSVIVSLALATGVLGHGTVRDYTIDGENYITYLPYDHPDYTQPPVGIGSHILSIPCIFQWVPNFAWGKLLAG